ncbi:MAG: hypothetical protein Q8Q33_08260 [Chlamydiota bacterium]|nr:hypothetical protein [Chlamydiota bacterium]
MEKQMDNDYVQCKGKTLKGELCKLQALPDSEYCGYHQEERQKIIKFFNEHRQGIGGFLAGAISDPIINDIYNFLKESLKYRHFVPPVKIRQKKKELMNFDDVLEYIIKESDLEAEAYSLEGWDLTATISALIEYTKCEYYPYDLHDPGKGFLEVVFPAAVGRGLRGASGNGPIFVFQIFKGIWNPLGELNGAWVKPNYKLFPTGLNAYGHISAFEAIEYKWVFRSGKYVCVQEREVRV